MAISFFRRDRNLIRQPAFALRSVSLAFGLAAIQLIGAFMGVSSVLSRSVFANAEMDRKYALETVGVLRSWDNVDGLFAEYVSAAYKESFTHLTRFRLQDLSKADNLLSNSKLAYAKAIEDPQILGSIARALRAQSLIRTRIFKEGPSYRFTIDWLHSPQMDVLATETFSLQDAGAGRNGSASDGSEARDFAGLGDIKAQLQAAMVRLFAKVPFVGHVTGRDNSDVTVNLGAATGLRRRDTLVIGTIEEVKKHPLLKEIVEWRTIDTGRVEIDSVDEALAFGHVIDQVEGHEIGRYQKVLRVIPRVEKAAPTPSEMKEDVSEEPPKLGFGMASLMAGGYSREYSSATTGVLNGGGFLLGAKGNGEIWLTRNFFIDFAMGYGSFGFSQNDANGKPTPATSVSGHVFTLQGDLGYTYLINGDFFGPRAWLKAGYQMNSFTLPISTSEATSPLGVNSVFIGIGGEIPVREAYGVNLELDFGLLNFASESGGKDGNASSPHNATIYLGGYYRYKARINFKLGFEIQGSGANFDTTKASISQKSMVLLPAVQYLF